MSVLVFLSSGLFLGWSLGANDAANIFGTAIGVKMVKFKTAAIITSIFVILGAGISGAGTSHTIGALGSVNEIAGAFMVALAAAITVFWMTKLQLPVSTSQAVVGAIVGWNLFSGSLTDVGSLTKIISSWIMSPVLAGIFAVIFYLIIRTILNRGKYHLLYVDFINRAGLVLIGAFGAYSLGANNIANVMGVFLPVSPFRPIETFAGTVSGESQLFVLGGIAIAAGVLTYSYRVMTTVGKSIIPLTPVTALVVVLSSSTVLFLFASKDLEYFLASQGLPTIPLVPVSSSQAIIGALMGIGLLKGGKGMNFRVLGRITSGWLTTPVIACLFSFICLFIIQNVFDQKVYDNVYYELNRKISEKLRFDDYKKEKLASLFNRKFDSAVNFKAALDRDLNSMGDGNLDKIIEYSRIDNIYVRVSVIEYEFSGSWFSQDEKDSLIKLNGMRFRYQWQLHDALIKESGSWKYKEIRIENKAHNSEVKSKLNYLVRKFSIKEGGR